MTGNELALPVCKRLSSDEVRYKKLLTNGVDENIKHTIDWLNTSEASGLLSVTDEDDFNDEFFSSSLYYGLNDQFNINSKNGAVPIEKFYKIGSRLGYNDLRRKLPWLNSDDDAIDIVKLNTEDIVLNLNRESGIGIKDILFASALAGLGVPMINQNLLQMPFQPIRGNVGIYTRCEMIARTEYSRAINTGTLQAYSNVGVREVDIITTGLPNVCDDCLDLENNNPYTLQEAMRILPLHPNCACSYSPIESSISNSGEIQIVDLT